MRAILVPGAPFSMGVGILQVIGVVDAGKSSNAVLYLLQLTFQDLRARAYEWRLATLSTIVCLLAHLIGLDVLHLLDRIHP